MTKEELKKKKEELFNEDFSIKINDINEIKNFCKELSLISGIQVCNAFGYINEHLPKVYNSVVNIV